MSELADVYGKDRVGYQQECSALPLKRRLGLTSGPFSKEHEGVMQHDLKCPKCGSFEIAHDSSDEPDEYWPRCRDCGYDWPPDEKA